MKNINNVGISNNATRLIITLLTSTFLTACGGSSGGSGNSSQAAEETAAAAVAAYSGNRNLAILDSTNTLKFADILLGASDLNSVVGRPDSTETNFGSLNGSVPITQTLTKIAKTQLSQSNLARREVSGTEQCDGGGSFSGNGDVDDDGIGWIAFDFSNCVSDDGVTLNGQMTMYVDSDGLNNISSYTLTFKQLSATEDGATTVQTGNLRYYEVYPPNGLIRNTATIFSTNSSTSEEYLLEDVVTENANSADYISGKIYISDEGYVTLDSSDDFAFTAAENLPLEGAMYMKGDNNSQARMTNHSYISYKLDLDSDGDGVYESSQIRNVQ